MLEIGKFIFSRVNKIDFMKPHKRKVGTISMSDYIKAARKGNRLAEYDLFGPGFHSTSKIHRSKKVYTRKSKHKDSTK